MRWILSGGLVLRLGLYVLSVYQDATPLKFTDIDYSVFSDAAAQVALKGASPYSRSTYRYTPLLAYLNIPNLYIHSSFGKWVFGLADLMTGYLLNALLKDFGVSALWRQGLSAFWVLNPFVAIISMRGSAESILGLLILLNVYFHLKKRYTLSALVYGLSVHFKVFPIIYALPLWLSISSSSALASSKSSPGVRTRSTTRKEYRDPFFSRERIRFGLISGCTFLALNAIFYHLYGYEFLHETYLYHITRKDHRHNFSLYFYPLYLSSVLPNGGPTTGLLSILIGPVGSFIPQFTLVFLLGGVLAKQNLFLALFSQTFAFVMMNKVCTSQYFMWYLFLLPLVLPKSRLCKDQWRNGVFCLLLWIVSQASWLFFAYNLEHLGQATFKQLCAASAFFYLSNAYILSSFISSHNAEDQGSKVKKAL